MLSRRCPLILLLMLRPRRRLLLLEGSKELILVVVVTVFVLMQCRAGPVGGTRTAPWMQSSSSVDGVVDERAVLVVMMSLVSYRHLLHPTRCQEEARWWSPVAVMVPEATVEAPRPVRPAETVLKSGCCYFLKVP